MTNDWIKQIEREYGPIVALQLKVAIKRQELIFFDFWVATFRRRMGHFYPDGRLHMRTTDADGNITGDYWALPPKED